MTGPPEEGDWPGPTHEDALIAPKPRQEIKLHGVLRDRTYGCGTVVVVFSSALDDADFCEFREYVAKWRVDAS